MRINTFIVDDEEHSIEVSMYYLAKYCPNVNVVGQARNINNAIAKINQLKVDLVLLDMNLKDGELGFDLVKAMPEANFKIIVVSAHSEYGIHAVKHNVCDYILKPLNSIELIKAVEKVVQQKKNSSANMGKLAISDKAGITLINIEEINYLEADGNYTHVYFNRSKEVITMRIGEIIEKLPKKKKTSWWNYSDSNNTIKKLIEVKVSFTNCTFKNDVLAYIPDEDSGYTFTANFEDEVIFKNCTFERKAMFKYSRFERNSDFSGSSFMNDSTFKYAQFDENISFKDTNFNKTATFKYANGTAVYTILNKPYF